MKNFIFISPNFPVNYWKFCAELKNNGMRVLGIGDCPYNELKQELRDGLHEYFKVSNLENYDEVFKASSQDAFDTAKYLAKKEGISVGISSGAALYAAIQYAKDPANKGKTIVALLPDSGDRYYSTPLFTE